MTLSRSLACVALFSYPVSSIEEVGDDSWTDAACATGAVEVVGAIHREVKVDHVVDHRGIEATRCDVSAHKHRVLLGKELLPELLSLLLRDHEPVSERVSAGALACARTIGGMPPCKHAVLILCSVRK